MPRTTPEALHQLVAHLLDEQIDLARHWVEDLRDAADTEGPELDASTLASLDRGIADSAEGRVKPLDHYEADRETQSPIVLTVDTRGQLYKHL